MSQQINLFNPVFLKQKKYFSTVAMLQALALLLLGCAFVTFYADYQVNTLSKEAALTTAQLGTAQMQLNKIKADFGPRQKSQALEQQIKKVEADMQSMKQVFDVLQKGEFGNTKGYAEYLRAFARQIVDGIWLTGLNIVGAGNEIGLQGRTLRPELVPLYINRLKREPIMQGKSFGSLEMQVPPSEQANKSDSATDRKNESAAYIEFNLH